MSRKPRYPSEGTARPTSVYIRPEHERVMDEARQMAKDIDMPFSVLLANALEDYMTLHQHLVPGEIRRATLAPDYKRV